MRRKRQHLVFVNTRRSRTRDRRSVLDRIHRQRHRMSGNQIRHPFPRILGRHIRITQIVDRHHQTIRTNPVLRIVRVVVPVSLVCQAGQRPVQLRQTSTERHHPLVRTPARDERQTRRRTQVQHALAHAQRHFPLPVRIVSLVHVVHQQSTKTRVQTGNRMTAAPMGRHRRYLATFKRTVKHNRKRTAIRAAHRHVTRQRPNRIQRRLQVSRRE